MGDRLFIAPPLPAVALKVQEFNQITYFVSQDQKKRCRAADLPCVITIRPSDYKLLSGIAVYTTTNIKLEGLGSFVKEL